MKKYLFLLPAIFFVILQKSNAQTPVAYYPLNGNTNDVSGNNLNGTLTGTLSPVLDRLGNPNSALNFNGATRIDVTDNPLLRPANVTLSAWVFSTNPQTGIIASKNLTNTTSNSYALFFLNNTIAAAWGTSGVSEYFTGPVVTSSVWHHVVLTFDDANNTAVLYLDGVQVNSQNTSLTIGYENSPFSIGSELESGVNSNFFNGTIDEVKVFNSALTAPQILTEFNSVTGQNYRSVASGNWSSPATWEVFDGSSFIPATVAPSSDDGVIIIRNGHNINVSTAVTTDQTIVETGATVTQNANVNLANGPGDDLVINGEWTWNSSALNAPGSVSVISGGILNIASGNIHEMFASINNDGTINWQAGDIYFGNNPVLTNNGSLIISSNNSAQNNNSHGAITNNGTITKSSSGITSFTVFNGFINNGTVNCNAGTINFNGVYTNAGTLGFNGGAFNVLSGGSFSHNAGASISGSGNFNNAGTFSINTNLVIAPVLILGNTGLINGAGNLTVNSPFSFTGTISGSGTLLLNANSNWNGGEISRATNIPAGVTFNIATANIHQMFASITNDGTIDWQAGDIYFGSNPVLTNNGSLVINSNNAAQNNNSHGAIINGGTITKLSTGTTTFITGNGFTNNGTLNCDAGAINFSGVYTNTGTFGFNGGTFNVLSGGSFSHNTGASISGSGNFNNAGTFSINTNLIFPSGLLLGNTGTINGAGNLTVNSPFSFSGTITGSGTLLLNANSNWNGGEISRTTTIPAAITFNIATANIHAMFASITSDGTIDWQAGDIYFGNNPVLTNNGSLVINSNNSAQNNNSHGAITNNGTITKSSLGITSFIVNNGFINNGTMNCIAGTINMNGAYSNNGIVNGYGIINMNASFLSNGVIAPGNSTGILTFNGSQPFSANSILQIEVEDGTGPGVGHDQLVRNGNLTLAGTLTVTSTIHVPLGTYTIINLTSGSVSGNFTTVNIPNGTSLQINPTNVQLIVSTVLPLNFISFTGTKQNNGALLQWKTANEINLSHFEIQRSDNGQNFIPVGTVSPGNFSYSFTDINIFNSKSVVFYRLKSIDNDGKFTTSAIIRLSGKQINPLTVYPNPAKNIIIINSSKKQDAVIINAIGQVVSKMQLVNGSQVLNVTALSAGIYYIKTDDSIVKLIKE